MKGMRRKRTDVLLTPVIDTATTVNLATDTSGLTFRKKILPLGTISYPDPDAPGGRRKVTFDAGYHATLIDAFNQRAVECPTVQLADARNAHNMDLTRTAGEVVGLSREQPGDQDGPGLYADVKARNEQHASLLHELPRLGVSAQIKERFGRVDGSKFRAALRHILVTPDPRVVGLGPWRAVSLSATDDGPVIDLTDTEYEEMDMTQQIDTNDGALALSDEDIEAALEAAAEGLEELDGHDDDAVQLSVHAGGGGSGNYAGGTTLALAEEDRVTIIGMQAKLHESDWKATRLELSNAGVPKADLDEAEKVLKYPGETVVELADTDGREFGEDARQVIRNLLELRKGTIDLSTPGGREDEPELNLADDDEKFLAAWEAHSGK